MLFCLRASLLLGSNILIVLIKLHLLVIQGKMLFKGIGGNPCLDRRTTPGTFNDTLSHTLLTLQLFAKEIADRREAPGILTIQLFPCSGTQVCTRSMRIRLVLHMKQAHHGIAVIQLVRILGRHTFKRGLHIRLASTQPDVTQPYIG